MDLGISGLASGFDWRAFVEQMVDVERAPQKRLLQEQNLLEQRTNAYGSIQTQLAVLQSRVDVLKDPALFDSRAAASSNSDSLSASVSAGAPLGTFSFNVTQMASAAKFTGQSNIGAPLSSTNDVSALTLSSANFNTSVTAGTITVNGSQVTIDTAGSLQDVFTAIETATGGAVTASYDSATDTISLNSASEIIIGSATDTSNFLQAAKLYNNGSGTISSSTSLGAVNRSTSLSAANFATAVNDGGGGLFKINGVEISYSHSADSLEDVMDRINDSDAGVVASYDSVNDRILLTNKSTGDVGISVQDVTGNFAAAAGLASGELTRGKNLLYSIDGGGTLVSQSNTITEATSGIQGLTLTALGEGASSVTVSSDTAAIKTAIENFITEYNKAQSIIETQTASSTDSKGAVSAGALSNESAAGEFASRLRSTAFATIAGFAQTMNQLEDIGIITNGNDNTLELDDPDKLDAALAGNLSGVRKLFTDETSGIAVQLDNYLESINGEEGTIEAKQKSLGDQIASIDTQILDLERIVQANRESLLQRFVAMETAQSQINQQMKFLQQRFGGAA